MSTDSKDSDGAVPSAESQRHEHARKFRVELEELGWVEGLEAFYDGCGKKSFFNDVFYDSVLEAVKVKKEYIERRSSASIACSAIRGALSRVVPQAPVDLEG